VRKDYDESPHLFLQVYIKDIDSSKAMNFYLFIYHKIRNLSNNN